MSTEAEQLYNPLFHFVKKRVRNQEDAEDLTQDIFYKLSRSEGKDILSTRRWVYAIARNTITDYYRKKSLVIEDADEVVLLEELERKDPVQELAKCIAYFVDQLPEDYREIMKLSELEGMAQKEIATSLNMKYSTVRSKVQRGRVRLKALFSGCCHIVQGGQGSIVDFRRGNHCSNNRGCP